MDQFLGITSVKMAGNIYRDNRDAFIISNTRVTQSLYSECHLLAKAKSSQLTSVLERSLLKM